MNKEDLESCGYKKYEGKTYKESVALRNAFPYYIGDKSEIIVRDENNLTITKLPRPYGDMGEVIFQGIIKDKQELVKLKQQLEI